MSTLPTLPLNLGKWFKWNTDNNDNNAFNNKSITVQYTTSTDKPPLRDVNAVDPTFVSIAPIPRLPLLAAFLTEQVSLLTVYKTYSIGETPLIIDDLLINIDKALNVDGGIDTQKSSPTSGNKNGEQESPKSDIENNIRQKLGNSPPFRLPEAYTPTIPAPFVYAFLSFLLIILQAVATATHIIIVLNTNILKAGSHILSLNFAFESISIFVLFYQVFAFTRVRLKLFNSIPIVIYLVIFVVLLANAALFTYESSYKSDDSPYVQMALIIYWLTSGLYCTLIIFFAKNFIIEHRAIYMYVQRECYRFQLALILTVGEYHNSLQQVGGKSQMPSRTGISRAALYDEERVAFLQAHRKQLESNQKSARTPKNASSVASSVKRVPKEEVEVTNQTEIDPDTIANLVEEKCAIQDTLLKQYEATMEALQRCTRLQQKLKTEETKFSQTNSALLTSKERISRLEDTITKLHHEIEKRDQSYTEAMAKIKRRDEELDKLYKAVTSLRKQIASQSSPNDENQEMLKLPLPGLTSVSHYSTPLTSPKPRSTYSPNPTIHTPKRAFLSRAVSFEAFRIDDQYHQVEQISASVQ